ncbi:MAG: anion permease [Candidatus Thiodiazotropha sp. (ex Epidulcina cf. delphinae)]|nr:anion permease [Candidatus Thiodiazotropha sp. (ex Epidulcina cf. delphinae)]
MVKSIHNASVNMEVMDVEKYSIINKPLIWILTILTPFVLYFYMSSIGINRDISLYTAIISITLIMWMFSLLPEFIPALIGLLLVLLFDLAPNDVILSGFSSPGFLLLFSVMGLGAVITSSGLTKRYTHWMIKKLPANSFAYHAAVFMTGFMFNPIVPTITGRAMIVAPILNNIVSGWDKKTRDKESTPLYTNGLDGINFLAPTFLTAAPANLMIFGLLPPQEQQAFDFIFWMYAASVTGLVMLVSYFIISAMYFRSFSSVPTDKKAIERECHKLGKMKWEEWIALSGIILLAVGIATTTLHKIPIPLVTFAVFCALLIIGVLSREEFIKRIDWSFLVLLASMIGVLATMKYLGLDKELVSQFKWLGDYMRHDFYLFVLVLTGMILLVRLFIPLNSAILIFAAALLPLASGAGVSPWIVGFIILHMCGTAFFGYQSPYIVYFRNLIKNKVPYKERKVQIFQGILVFVKLGAIYISIPFWLSIGVL